MRQPIGPGARGPAVEDIQQRLLRLGYSLGPSGVDGIFLGATLEAVRVFQREHNLDEDGLVGPQTWAALVDATFVLGDRLLYLRHPHFHGADVRTLQGALNVLGFACGPPDGIFGTFTERAVREFQANTGLASDGIVGPETVRAVMRLRHVWEGKDPASPASLSVAPARAADVLARLPVAIEATDAWGEAIAERVTNLARATHEDARVSTVSEDAPGAAIRLRIGADLEPASGRPYVVIAATDDEGIEARLLTALMSASAQPVEVSIRVPDIELGERDEQRIAVRILDAICSALGPEGGVVVSSRG